jgi:hypothetical protein
MHRMSSRARERIAVPSEITDLCLRAVGLISAGHFVDHGRGDALDLDADLSAAVDEAVDAWIAWRTRPPLVDVQCEKCMTRIGRWRLYPGGVVMEYLRPKTYTEPRWKGLAFASRANAGKGNLLSTPAAGGMYHGTYDYRPCPRCHRKGISVRPERRLRLTLEAMASGRKYVEI